MARGPPFFATVLGLLLVVGASGCVGGARDAQASSSQSNVAAPTDGTGASPDDVGAIQGVVLSDEVQPIQGAEVAIAKPIVLEATTNEAGEFAFERLAPGTYELFVQAIGYGSGQKRIDVVAGEAATVRFVLDSFLIAEPHHATFIDDDLMTCGFSWGPFGFFMCGEINWFVPDALDQNRMGAFHLSEPRLTAFVGTLEWTPNAALGAKRMAVSMGSGAEGASNTSYGGSPLTTTVILEEPAEKKGNITLSYWPESYCDPSTVTNCLSSPPESLLQLIIQQEFTMYSTHFYDELPTPGFTGAAPT